MLRGTAIYVNTKNAFVSNNAFAMKDLLSGSKDNGRLASTIFHKFWWENPPGTNPNTFSGNMWPFTNAVNGESRFFFSYTRTLLIPRIQKFDVHCSFLQANGKGSLWCVDPEYRPNLIQALKKQHFPAAYAFCTPPASPPR